MMTKINRMNDMALGDVRPEKAGVGGSIPSLATTSKSITYVAVPGKCKRVVLLFCNARIEVRLSLWPKTQTVSVYTRLRQSL
jgi:hypothetical protein